MITQVLLGLLFACCAHALDNFTIVNGQIYTPGLAIVDAPQPYTPEGGDFLQVAMDISGNGRLPQPPYAPNIESGIWNITMFLFSYTTGLNLTISNGTTDGWTNNTSEAAEFHCNATTTQGFQNAGCEEIMAQEPGSTVKHVNWAWPDCFVGDGNHAVNASARGPYNVSIHQSFRINNTDYYTIFNLPIQVTNSIPNDTDLSANHTRPLCALRTNPLQNQTSQDASTSSPTSQPYLGGNVSIGGSGSSWNGNGNGNGNGGGDNGGLPSGLPVNGQNGAGAGNRPMDYVMTMVHCLLLVAIVSAVVL